MRPTGTHLTLMENDSCLIPPYRIATYACDHAYGVHELLEALLDGVYTIQSHEETDANGQPCRVIGAIDQQADEEDDTSFTLGVTHDAATGLATLYLNQGDRDRVIELLNFEEGDAPAGAQYLPPTVEELADFLSVADRCEILRDWVNLHPQQTLMGEVVCTEDNGAFMVCLVREMNIAAQGKGYVVMRTDRFGICAGVYGFGDVSQVTHLFQERVPEKWSNPAALQRARH